MQVYTDTYISNDLKIKAKKQKIIPVLVAAIIMLQNPIWLLWNGIGTMISYLLLSFLFYLKLKIQNQFRYNIYTWFILLLSICTFIVIPFFKGFHVSSIFILLSFALALTLTVEDRIKAMDYVTKCLAIILLISLPPWLIHAFVSELPHFSEIDLGLMKGVPGHGVIMYNHLFFVTNSDASTLRFYSMFDEPGVLGTLSAFVLFANKYDFKSKYNLVILVGAFFSFSFAFYLLSIFGYIMSSVKDIKKVFISFTVLMLIGVAAIYFLQDNAAFQQAVISRFSEGASDNLDNRTGYYADKYYQNFIHTPECLFGVGMNKLSHLGILSGASYKLFILEYGFVGTFILFLLYWMQCKKKSYEILVFYILFFASFLQRPLAFTVWQCFVFACTVGSFKYYKRKNLYAQFPE